MPQSGGTMFDDFSRLMSDAVILPIAQRIGWSSTYILFACIMGIGLAATFLAAEPLKVDRAMDAKETEKPLWTPRGFFDAVAGPFIIFPGIIQFAMSPLSVTSKAPRIARSI